MKFKVPVHVSMDLEVEVGARKHPDQAMLREVAEAMVEKKLQSMFGPSSKFSGSGRARATASRARDEKGNPVFRQPSPRQPKPKFGETLDLPPPADDGRCP